MLCSGRPRRGRRKQAHASKHVSWKGIRTSQRERSATRDSEDREARYAYALRKGLNIDGPIQDTASRLGSRQAEAWPVQCEDAEAMTTGYIIDRAGLEARRGIAMEVEEWFAVGITVLGITKDPAIREDKCLILAGCRHCTTSSFRRAWKGSSSKHPKG